jgi:hypothetical protein
MNWLTVWEYDSSENTTSAHLVPVDDSDPDDIGYLISLIESDSSGRWGYSMFEDVPEGAAEFALSVFPADLPGSSSARIVPALNLGENRSDTVSGVLNGSSAEPEPEPEEALLAEDVESVPV